MSTTEVEPSELVTALYRYVVATPMAVAVVARDGQLTFADLWSRSGSVAVELGRRGVDPGATVGVLIDSSLDLEIGLWGVLRAGAAYLPLSPEYPTARLAFAVDESAAMAIVTTASLQTEAHSLAPAAEVLVVGTEPDAEPSLPRPSKSDLAYLIFTSGSTGNPKGVMIEQRSIVNQMLWFSESQGIGPGSRVLHKTPFSFDAAQWELLAVAVGATVVMASPEDYRNPSALIDIALDFKVSVLQCVPTLWAALVDTDRFNKVPLRHLFSGGEVLTSHLARQLLTALPTASLTNLYGPTETTINSSSHLVTKTDLESSAWAIPIGRGVRNTRLLILNDDGSPSAPGEIGELCIGGPQVARGYVNRPEQTAQRFTDIVDAGQKVRVYRTGDLASWNAEEHVVYVGRRDSQLKINGYRIELDEVRLAIEAHDWVKQAAVVPWTTRSGTRQLAAFIELDESEAALMDGGGSSAHHRSKSTRTQVRAQLTDRTHRTTDTFTSSRPIVLPGRDAPPETEEAVFARKTYRTFHGQADCSDLIAAVTGSANPPKVDGSRGPDGFTPRTVGDLLRWFGPFTSNDRLLAKYAYASPGALNSTQVYMEFPAGHELEGVHYFHPGQHTLTRVGKAASDQVRVHFVGVRSRILSVYAQNVDEVLHFEAGHMLGVLEEAAAATGYRTRIVTGTSPDIDVFGADSDHLLTLTAELVPPVEPEGAPNATDDVRILVAPFDDADARGRVGFYELREGRLQLVTSESVRRKDVIAINQAVYDRATFGIALLARRSSGWAGFVQLGRRLHRLQRNQNGLGWMSAGYSSLTGQDMPAARRTDAVLRSAGAEEQSISYFALGGGISQEQQSSRGMEEDVIHMRGPAEILRDDLRERLPDYMVPTRVAVVEAFPLTPSGKVSLKDLEHQIEREEANRPLISPRTPVESALLGIWSHLLGTSSEISVTDTFFDVGGNSLTGVALVNHVNRTFGLRLPLQALFTSSTIELLAQEVESGGSNITSRLVNLTPEEAGQTFRKAFIWPGLGGYPLSLREFALAMPGRKFIGVQSSGINTGERVHTSVEDMAQEDAQLVESEQPQGPITLIGYSFGARIAFETAYQLEQRGRTVDNLILIAPGSPVGRDDDGIQLADSTLFTNRAFLRILLSVFAGRTSSPLEDRMVRHVTDRVNFIDFIGNAFPDLPRDLTGRITDVVEANFSFKYTFEELRHRTIRADMTVIKATGDDYSFLEDSANYSAHVPRQFSIDHDHYSIIRGPGLGDLVERLQPILTDTERNIFMPHVHIHHFPANLDEARRNQLADDIAEAVTKAFNGDPDAVTVALEPVAPTEWQSTVYEPEILGRAHLLARGPRYGSASTKQPHRELSSTAGGVDK